MPITPRESAALAGRPYGGAEMQDYFEREDRKREMNSTYAPPANEPLYIHCIEIDGVKRIEHFRCDANGKHIKIEGENALGKTSIVDAIALAIEGLSSKTMPDPIHHGWKSAWVRLDIGPQEGVEFQIVRVIKPKRTELSITRTDGGACPNTQAFLDSLLGHSFHYPMRFLESDDKGQVKEVLKILGVKPPVEEVSRILGRQAIAVPCNDGEPVDAVEYLAGFVDEKRGSLVAERKVAGQEATRSKAAVRKQEEEIDRLIRAGEAVREEDTLSVEGCTARLAELQAQADKRKALEESYQRGVSQMKMLEQTYTQKLARAQAIEQQILTLQSELSDLQRDNMILLGRLDKGHEEVAARQAKVNAVPDPRPEMETIRQQINQAQEQQKAAAVYQAAKNQLGRMETEAAEREAIYQQFDSAIDKIRKLQLHLLDGVQTGIPDLSIGDGRLMYKGSPFRTQASRAESFYVATALSMIGRKGRLNIIAIDNGESLGTEMRKAVFDTARRTKCQVVFLGMVAGQNELKIELVERE